MLADEHVGMLYGVYTVHELLPSDNTAAVKPGHPGVLMHSCEHTNVSSEMLVPCAAATCVAIEPDTLHSMLAWGVYRDAGGLLTGLEAV